MFSTMSKVDQENLMNGNLGTRGPFYRFRQYDTPLGPMYLSGMYSKVPCRGRLSGLLSVIVVDLYTYFYWSLLKKGVGTSVRTETK